jgi:peptidoglycan/xylan/chitin deacetylase (PgdA/CDA1 family)
VATSILMYHELAMPNRQTCESTPAYLRYVVERRTFASQIGWLTQRGLDVVSLGEACHRGFDRSKQVVASFDDGCESDVEIAAPLLLESSCTATFFVVSRWLDRRGFLSRSQLRQLHDMGFEIGSHSASHAFLSDIPDEALRQELVESKRVIEDAIGAPVRHLSCPGGRWSRRVATAAASAGYETVSTSRIGHNNASADPLALTRCVVRSDTDFRTFQAMVTGEGLARLQLQNSAIGALRRVLGPRVFASLRDFALKH